MQIARLVDLSGQCREDVAGPRAVVAVGVVARALEQRRTRRLGGRELARQAADGVGVDAAELGRPFRRVALLVQVIAEPLEALAVLVDEILVVQVIVDDLLAHGQGHGGVGSRTDRDPLVGFLGGLGKGGIDHDQLAAALLRLEQSPAFEQALVGAQIVHAPEDDVLRAGEVMHREEVSKGRQAGRAPVALAAHGVAERHIGRAVKLGDQLHHEDRVGIVVRHEADRFRPVLLFDRLQLVGDERQRLVPGNPFELAPLTLGIGPQHGIAQTVRILRQPGARHALCAARADVVRRIGIALVIDDLSIAHIDLGRTGPRAGVTEALDHLRPFDLGDAIGKPLLLGAHDGSSLFICRSTGLIETLGSDNI